jgi:tetratricopeptide (TPR) repeat protein
MKHQALAVMLLFAVPAGLPMLSGCAGKLGIGKNKTDENALVIPDFPSADEQFKFARMYQNAQLIAPELDRRRLQMQKIGECYHRVITNFPNDSVYVPLTYLELGDCAAQSDEFDMAVNYYQQAAARSQDDFVLARSQYSIARIYDSKGRFEEAKAMYKDIIEKYGKSESGKVRDVVTRAGQLYVKVHEKGQ